MKQVYINKRPTRYEAIKAFILDNFFSRLKVLLYISLLLSGSLYYLFPLAYALIPFYLHCVVLFFSYYKHKVKKIRNENIWKQYVSVYGNKDGVIPREIRLAHKKKIRKGEKIEI